MQYPCSQLAFRSRIKTIQASMRISAIALFFLAIIHLFLNHVSTDVSCTSYQLIAARYANPYWRVYDWLLLTLAFYIV
jgi:succinate dehydrogenase hydrophobic anchor subunit